MVGQKWSCSSTSQISQQFATELRYGKAETGQREHGAKPGDLIEIFRQHYQHWAVYVGDDEVVHLTNTGHCSSGISCRSSGQVTRDNIWIVVSSDKFKINNLLDHKHMPRETRVIVKEACDMVGQPVSYSLTTHNCEHFATELRYGKATSRQNSGPLFFAGLLELSHIGGFSSVNYRQMCEVNSELRRKDTKWRKLPHMGQTLHGAKPGDMIEISRGMYEEWAVYVGNDEVVHLTLKGQKPIVKCSNIWELAGSDPLKVNNLLDKECNPRKPDDIVNEARQMVGKEWSCSGDSGIPEHFVRELRYGKAESGQRQHGAKPGDLIEIERGMFQHWAVYVGGDAVVHLTNLGSGISGSSGTSGNMLEQVADLGQVTRDNIWEVISSSCFKVNNLLDEDYEPHDPKVIVKEALAMVGQKLSYSVASFNCEHFATVLRYGKPESRQVKTAAVIGGVVGVGLGVALIGSLLKDDDKRERRHHK
ncbi:uncharacterized protein LOC121526534 [Cheilinus undulatus]|uniref:uncharacterized protein LOC121526534 n=1 Tax=Cheilinus undulatus TaxID=241271 RepID=UPI001BD3BBE3|nr:uncharacterized protein LOC121526534 [Cheilinus undulatus]